MYESQPEQGYAFLFYCFCFLELASEMQFKTYEIMHNVQSWHSVACLNAIVSHCAINNSKCLLNYNNHHMQLFIA